MQEMNHAMIILAECRDNVEKQRNSAAMTIQRVARGKSGRNRAAVQQEMARAAAEIEGAVLLIQRVYRARKALLAAHAVLDELSAMPNWLDEATSAPVVPMNTTHVEHSNSDVKDYLARVSEVVGQSGS